MVILYEPFGGLSNRLFQHIHFNSFCKHNKIEFINYFLDYGTKINPGLSIKTKLITRFKKVLTAVKAIKLIEFNNDREDFSLKENVLKSNSLVFVKGWGYRNKLLTSKDRAYYKDLFYPGYAEKGKGIIDPQKINIAVHIRRGDYINWQNGIYYFKDDAYTKAIDQLIALTGQNYKLLIFSNDNSLNKDLYNSKYPGTYISLNDEKTDHYLMSQCSYIMGPPSTFSMWASYIGNTKFYHIKNENEQFNLTDFEICNG